MWAASILLSPSYDPGHTKFSPDELFACIAHSFYKEDVFTGEELAYITARYSFTSLLDATGIKNWRARLPVAYKPVPNIKDLHDFRWRHVENGRPPQLDVRKLCSGGEYTPVCIHINPDIVPDLRSSVRNYEEAGMMPGLSVEKTARLLEMYNTWISPERRLEFLPPYVPPEATPSIAAVSSTGPVSSALAQEREDRRARRRCSTPGCSGLDHKNVRRWFEGHITRSGCPIYHNIQPPQPS